MQVEQIRNQLDRILASPSFAEAERAKKFLRFVVEQTLAGREDEIKEAVIGIEVLGRPASYDPRSDPIVRVEAGRLRTRLVAYYQSEGLNDPVVIELPKGAYVPRFVERAPSTRAWLNRRIIAVFVGGAALFGFAVCWVIWPSLHRDYASLAVPLRLSVLPPQNSEFQNIAISPDGQYLAFTATSGNVTSLWIRPLESPEARVLPGTDQAAFPFWSPDSKFIAFFSVGKLKKVFRSGGPAQTICDVQPAFGGTWNSRNIILFAQRPSGTIFQVSADGGKPTAVTVLDRAHGEISHLFPSFLPDGRHFLYSVVMSAPAEASVRVGAVGSRDSKPLLTAELGSAYSPPCRENAGSLIFAYHGALMSQPFDLRRLELSGSATQLAPQVRHSGGRADFSISSNCVLAYQGESEKDRQLTWLDRNGKELGVIGERNSYHGVTLSSNEKRLAIEVDDPASGRLEVWVSELEKGSLLRLGAPESNSLSPIWSTDAEEVVFSSGTRDGMALVRQQIEKLTATPLLERDGVHIATDWSGDGRWLAYSSSSQNRQWLGIWVKPLPSGSEDPGRGFSAVGHNECCAVFSPHALGSVPRWIAYASDETGRYEVFVKDFPSGTRRWQISTAGGWQPHWRDDGRELFYLALDGELMSSEIVPESSFIAKRAQALFKTTISPVSYPTLPGNSYTPGTNGQRFLVNYRVQQEPVRAVTVLVPAQ